MNPYHDTLRMMGAMIESVLNDGESDKIHFALIVKRSTDSELKFGMIGDLERSEVIDALLSLMANEMHTGSIGHA